MIRLKIILFIILFYSSTAYAATYYIDYNSGLDSNNGTSTATPWKRSPGMVGFSGSYSHTAGDIFVFKGGVTWPVASLPLYIGYSGATENPDIYMGGQQCGFIGSAAAVKCNGTTPCGSNASASCNGGAAWGSGYPVFDGGAVDGMMVIKDNAQTRSYLIFDGIKIVNVGYIDGSGQGISFYGGGTSLETKNCYLDTNGVNAWSYTVPSTGMTPRAIYFHDNAVINSGRTNFDGGTNDNNIVNDVKFYNNLFMGTGSYTPGGYHCDGIMVGGANAVTYGITNLLIYNNKFYGLWKSATTAAIYLNGSAGYYSINGAKIYNNIISFEQNTNFTYSPASIVVAASNQGYQNNIEIYNNTISQDAYANASVTSCISVGSADNVTIKNNILSGCDNAIMITPSASVGANFAIDYNLYHTYGGGHLIYDQRTSDRCNTLAACQVTPFYQEAHGVVGDPKYVAIPDGTFGSGNWQLQSSSAAIGKGANLYSIFTTDKLGITRPEGTAWDIGAYEYNGGNNTSMIGVYNTKGMSGYYNANGMGMIGNVSN